MIVIISIKFSVHWKIVSLGSSLRFRIYYLAWVALANHLTSLTLCYYSDVWIDWGNAWEMLSQRLSVY